MSFHPAMPYGTEQWHRSQRATLPEGPEFAYTKENRDKFEEFASHYAPENRLSTMLHALYLAQEQQGYISNNAVRHIAGVIGCTTADVEDAVSYYVMFHRAPVGKFVLQVCTTLSCALAGAEREGRSERQRARDHIAAAKARAPVDEARKVLDDLVMGRLRIASKGTTRSGLNGALETLTPERQSAEGMYMLGQVATLRAEVTDIATLHRQVTDDAAALLNERLAAGQPEAVAAAAVPPADVAIVGIATLLPKAADVREYWENILKKVDGISEIPSHRWDWRLYFDSDRHAKDKIYSKWGGFLDDVAFDPMKFGMPPKSLEAIDPMQLMALEVAHRALADAGYVDRPFDRERASVILGASGGTGDVGTQYGLRAELPRARPAAHRCQRGDGSPCC